MKPLSKRPAMGELPVPSSSTLLTTGGVEGRSANYYSFYSTSYGTGAIIFSGQGIRALVLPCSKKEMERRVKANGYRKYHKMGYNIEGFSVSDLKKALSEYFAFKEVKFNFPLNLDGFSKFERDVCRAVSGIPCGEVKSYQEVAKEVGRPNASRAVGNVLAKNPIPVIIPCHRVTRKDGNIGGFSAGIDWKKKLLQLEKVNGMARSGLRPVGDRALQKCGPRNVGFVLLQRRTGPNEPS